MARQVAQPPKRRGGRSALGWHHANRLLIGLPVLLAVVSLWLFTAGHSMVGVAVMMFLWGVSNSAMPVAWSTWVSRGVRDQPEAGGGLMVAAIQLAIMLGAALGGLLLDWISIGATFAGGGILLVSAALVLGYERRTAHIEATTVEAEPAQEPVLAES